MKWIIYSRKSTDRDDRQANTLEHQMNNCRLTSTSHQLNIVEEISESRSAKEEYSRPWFNLMIEKCNTKKIDYLIIDEPKRLSRNNIDTSRIIDLLDKKKIRWILCTSRVYLAENSRDKFLLQLDLSLSKMDNEDRSLDVKNKMASCTQRTWRFLAKAPYGYKNVTLKKWHKVIEVDEFHAKVVKDMFSLRIQWKAYSAIWELIQKKYGNATGLVLITGSIHRIINRKFYYWIISWTWKEIIWSHEPIITKDIYEQANAIWKWVYEMPQTKKANLVDKEKYYFKWFVKDISGRFLSAYYKKWHIYYKNQTWAVEHVNINQKIIFEKFWCVLQKFDEEFNCSKKIDEMIIKNLIKENVNAHKKDTKCLNTRLNTLTKKQDRLLDLKVDWVISDNIYLAKNNKIESDIFELKEQNKHSSLSNIIKKSQRIIELSGCLYKAYLSATDNLKSQIIKAYGIELLINTKKELQIKDSPLFKSSKMLNSLNGMPEEIDSWTFFNSLNQIETEDVEFLLKNIKYSSKL